MSKISRLNSLPSGSLYQPADIVILPDGREFILNNSQQWIKKKSGIYLEDKGLLTSENLNLITVQGIYHQTQNIQATSANNYPITCAGTLEVRFGIAAEIFQQYTILTGQTEEDTIYTRGNYGGVWSVWKKSWNSGNFNPGSKVNVMENAIGLGFNSGLSTAGVYAFHAADGYIQLATQSWVNTTLQSFASQNWVSQNFIPKTHPVFGITASQIADWDATVTNQNNFLTTNTNQNVLVRKSFRSYGQHADYNNLWIYSDDLSSNPSITFNHGNNNYGQIKFSNAGFRFTDQNGAEGNQTLQAGAFAKFGRTDDRVLLAGGGDKLISDFLNSSSLNGYALESWVNTNFIPKTHPVFNVTQAMLDSYATEAWATSKFVGLGSASSYFLAFDGFENYLGRDGNLVGYLFHSNNFNPGSKVNSLENATAIGFSFGDSEAAPYFYHATNGYRFLATQTWVSQQGFASNANLVNYLPKTGGNMSGMIYFDNNLGGIQGTMADNDFWRVGGGNTGSNNGYLELATGDDSNEEIYVSQYAGQFTSLVRRAKLLDASGNTIFPGILSSGSLIQSEDGFQNRTYKVNQRNKIWNFGDSSTYGLSYYQGSYHALGEGIAFHFGTGSDYQFYVRDDGSIFAKGTVFAPAFSSLALPGSQIINTNSTQIYLGNPSVDVIIETKNSELFHNRAGYGVGSVWTSHNHTPFKTRISIGNLNEAVDSGIYRQEIPTSGFNYTTTLNLSSGDGRQQLTIERSGGGMKFRGTTYGSGDQGWSPWKTVLTTDDFTPANYVPYNGANQNLNLGQHFFNGVGLHSPNLVGSQIIDATNSNDLFFGNEFVQNVRFVTGNQFTFNTGNGIKYWFNSGAFITKGDINLEGAIGDDLPDIIWTDSTGAEKHRLWDGVNTLSYRTNAGAVYGLVHTGNLDASGIVTKGDTQTITGLKQINRQQNFGAGWGNTNNNNNYGLVFETEVGPGTGDNRGTSIGFNSASSGIQAGIHVRSNGDEGTSMAFSTTHSFASGPQIGMSMNNYGKVNFERVVPSFQGLDLVTQNYVDNNFLSTSYTSQTKFGPLTLSSGLGLPTGQRIALKGFADGSHYLKHFTSDDSVGFGINTKFTIKPYNDEGYNYFSVDANGLTTMQSAQINGQLKFKVTVIDLTAYDPNTFYPVTLSLTTNRYTKIKVYRTLEGSYGVPPYSNHNAGFVCIFEIDVLGHGWGATDGKAYLREYKNFWVNGGIETIGYKQMNNSTQAVVYLRGGSKYDFEADIESTPVLRTSYYEISGEVAEPTTTRIWQQFVDSRTDTLLNNFLTTNTDQKVSGVKQFNTFGGSYTQFALQAYSDTGSFFPGISFHKENHYAGSIQMIDGNTFAFRDNPGTGNVDFVARTGNMTNMNVETGVISNGLEVGNKVTANGFVHSNYGDDQFILAAGGGVIHIDDLGNQIMDYIHNTPTPLTIDLSANSKAYQHNVTVQDSSHLTIINLKKKMTLTVRSQTGQQTGFKVNGGNNIVLHGYSTYILYMNENGEVYMTQIINSTSQYI